MPRWHRGQEDDVGVDRKRLQCFDGLFRRLLPEVLVREEHVLERIDGVPIQLAAVKQRDDIAVEAERPRQEVVAVRAQESGEGSEELENHFVDVADNQRPVAEAHLADVGSNIHAQNSPEPSPGGEKCSHAAFNASGAVPVAWQTVPNATGYFLMAVGSRDANTIVMWSSSEIQFNQMGAFDYLAPAEVARLIAQRVVLNPATTQCTVPAEFSQGLQGASLMMTAFGPEANFATPRPASASRTWRPDWNVKFRTRSTYAGLLGQDLEAMMRGDRTTGRDSSQGQQQQPQRRRRGLGGIIGGVLGQ